VFILALSWDTVEPIEWGLKYNSISKSITNETIYDGGRYLIWPFHSFIDFPRALKTIEFSTRRGANAQPLRTRTAEGLALGLHISFQYQLIASEIPALYAMNNQDYEATFIRIARDTILQAAGGYEAPKYWESRSKIAKDMQHELDVELRKAHAKCVYLQLLQIDLPQSYENSIVETQVEVQNSKMKKYEQEAALIRQEINIMRSQTAQDINILNSTAQGKAYQIRKEAEATAQKNTITAEQNIYTKLTTDLALSAEDLNQYIFYNGLLGKQSQIVVGFKNMMYTQPGKH
jgi:regulator of protease activity HflC (stomatin/prohibitin superfamily)